MVYKCEICNEIFAKLCNYERHLNKKTTCDPIKRKQQKQNKLKCIKCQKIFSRISNLTQHDKICTGTQQKQDKLEQMIENLTKQNEILVENMNKQNEIFNEKMDKLMNKDTKTININNTVNQQQNVFNIVPFGKEKFDYITNKDYNKIFKQGYKSLQMFIPMIYCNEQKPENMNIYISNFKDDTVKVFNGKDWIIEKKSDILHDIYNSKRDHLEYKFEDMQDELTDNAKYFFNKFKEGNTDSEIIKSIQYDIKNILYANRNNVIKKPHKKQNVKKVKLIENINDPDYIPIESMFF